VRSHHGREGEQGDAVGNAGGGIGDNELRNRHRECGKPGQMKRMGEGARFKGVCAYPLTVWQEEDFCKDDLESRG